VLWAIAGVHGVARGEDPAEYLKNAPIDDVEFRLPLSPEEAAETERWLPLLGAPGFQEREEASKRLAEIGAPAFARLREWYHRSADYEVRARIEKIVRESYLEHHLYRNFGFLGISRNPYTPNSQDDARIPVGHVGLKVDRTTPNSGAQRAGLEQNDIIVSLDGEPLQGAGQRAFEIFSAAIRSRKPGGRVTLGILRGPQEINVEVTLTRPPLDTQNGGQTQKLGESKALAATRFETWWKSYFRESSTPETR
jgi:C-terminal processing protease CtpA/Prc